MYVCMYSKHFSFFLYAGDFTKWLIAPWQSIRNGGAAYTSGTRLVTKSNINQSPCMQPWCMCTCVRSITCAAFTDRAPWVWNQGNAEDPLLTMYVCAIMNWSVCVGLITCATVA